MLCEKSGGCDVSPIGDCDYGDPGDWSVKTVLAGPFEFPPTEPEDVNSQACCADNSDLEQLEKGCRQDCRRAACNEAIAALEQALANHMSNPQFGCDSVWFPECYNRVVDGLNHWIKEMRADYDICTKAAELGDTFSLSNNTEIEAGSGALACGKLQLGCELSDEPYDLEESCSTSLNQPQQASALILECDIEGDIEIDGTEGNEFTTFEGTVIVRKESPCTDDSCWFSIDGFEIDADSFADSGYIARDMHASLAYQGFGSFDSNSDEGVIAWGMFGLEVSMEAATPSLSLQPFAFRIGNSDAAIFELSGQQFQIIDAYFAWDDHDLVITSDVANCTCVNCSE